MSPDAQRFEIEHARRKLADWQVRQPDFRERLNLASELWLSTATKLLGISGRQLVAALEQTPNGDTLVNMLSEVAFGLPLDKQSLFERYARGAGLSDSGLCIRYLRRLARSEPALWQITAIERGMSRLHIKRWDSGRSLSLLDRDAARSYTAGDLLLGRVIAMPAGAVLGEATVHFGSLSLNAESDTPALVESLLSHTVIEMLQPSTGTTTDPEKASPGRNRDRTRSRRPHTSTDVPPHKPRNEPPNTPPHTPREALPQSGADRERLLDRVRKLFAMAQQTDASPHEAEIALRRCQSLMAKYGISEADLETSTFGNAEFTSGRTVPMHVKYLASAVATLHDVLFVTGRGGFAEFRGYEVDANVARMTLDYLLDAAERALASRKRDGNFPAGRSAAYDYRMGFASEVARRITALVNERNKAQQQAAGTGTALAIRKREIVERECGQHLARSSFRGRGARDATAHAAGTDDGSRVSLDQQVESTQKRDTLPQS